jgi:hypothetical protein
VQIVTKCGVVLLILELILSIEALIILGIWAALFLTSSTGIRARHYFGPKILSMNSTVDDVIQIMTANSVIGALNGSRSKTTLILKEFYIFEYQRWWLGKEWVPSHYSDEGRKVVLEARKDPPVGWTWLGPWEVEKNNNADAKGFEYTNDLIQNIYSPSKSLKTIRRRKWVRACKRSVP